MRILIVDDEEVLRDVLDAVLRREGFDVVSASTGEEALSLLDGEEIDLVILDIMLPGISGIDTLRSMRISNPHLPVIIITAFSSIDGAIEAMKHGAYHYIPKPFKNEEVIITVNKALEQRRLSNENERLKAELSEKYAYANIIGKSEAMRKVYELVRLAAPSRSNILIAGESGTGKELIAKAIHHASPRARNAFGHVAVQLDGLDELLPDRVDGIERGHRILEDHRDLAPADLPQPRLLGGQQVLALPQRLAARDGVAPGVQAHDGEVRDALAAPGLAHDAQHLALLDREVDSVDGLDYTVVGVEMRSQVFDFEQRQGGLTLTKSAGSVDRSRRT
jgi:CheY-like chemotaxis protein